MTILKRQFITDTEGNPIGVILPLEEYSLIEKLLKQLTPSTLEADKLKQMEEAAEDPLFLADLRETIDVFAN